MDRHYVRKTAENIEDIPGLISKYVNSRFRVKLTFEEFNIAPLNQYDWKTVNNADYIRLNKPLRQLKHHRHQFYHYVGPTSGTKSKSVSIHKLLGDIPGVHVISCLSDYSNSFQVALLIYLGDLPKMYKKFEGSVEKVSDIRKEIERIDEMNQQILLNVKQEFPGSPRGLSLKEDIAAAHEKLRWLRAETDLREEEYIKSNYVPCRLSPTTEKQWIKHSDIMKSIGAIV